MVQNATQLRAIRSPWLCWLGAYHAKQPACFLLLILIFRCAIAQSDASGAPIAAHHRFLFSDIRLVGNSLFSRAALLGRDTERMLGKEISLTQLRTVADEITLFYQNQGYMLAHCSIPAQKLEGGIVELHIVEGVLERVEFDHEHNFDASSLTAYTRHIGIRQPVSRHAVERALLLLKDHSGSRIGDARFSPGDSLGQSILTIPVKEGEMISFRMDTDNHGSQFTGRNRLSASADLNSPFGYGERFSARVMRSDKRLSSGRLAAQMPIGADGLTLSGSVNHTQYSLGDAFATLDAVGQSTSGDLSLRYPIIRSTNLNLYAQAGLERRKLVDEVRAFAVRTDKHATLGSASLTTDWRDSWGGGGASQVGLTISQGRLGIDSAVAAAIDEVSARTQGRYTKLVWNVERQQALVGRWNVTLSWRGQFAGKNLDSSEKFSLGGANGVRAYPSGEGSGDHGWLLSGELRHPLGEQVAASAFFDTGGIKVNANAFLATPNAKRLSGVGLGLAGATPFAGGSLDWRITAAWRADVAPVSEADRRPRVWAQAGWRF